jgi:23S rRNA pseudouridine2605 synthase
MRTSVGYIGADAFHNKGRGGRGGKGGGGRGGKGGPRR